MKIFFAAGSIFALIAVAAGAFGAHALRARLAPDLLDVFETGARYQMYHALALLAVGWFSTQSSSGLVGAAGWAFILGILIFSGSLYILALADLRWMGAITPIGGFAFLVGWGCLAVAAMRS